MDYDLKRAIEFIRRWVIQQTTEEDMDCVKVRAEALIPIVRAELESIGKELLMEFDIGPVACMVASEGVPGVKNGSVCLSFSHKQNPDETAGTVVTPLYK